MVGSAANAARREGADGEPHDRRPDVHRVCVDHARPGGQPDDVDDRLSHSATHRPTGRWCQLDRRRPLSMVYKATAGRKTPGAIFDMTGYTSSAATVQRCGRSRPRDAFRAVDPVRGGHAPLLYSRRARTSDSDRGAMPDMTRQPLTVAVVGATGVVERVQVLRRAGVPARRAAAPCLRPVGRSTVSIDGRSHEIQEASRRVRGRRYRPLLRRRRRLEELAPAGGRPRRDRDRQLRRWRMDPVDPARRQPGQPR